MQVQIYCLIDPITLKVRYIGRTSKKILKRRLREHVTKSINKHIYYPDLKKNHKENWICYLKKLNLEPIIKKLTVVKGWKESYIEEKRLLNKYQDRLLNHSDKGEGSKSPISIEQRIQISNTLKRKYLSGELKVQGERKFYVYDNEGNFLFERTNVRKTSEELNLPETHISKCLNNKSKTFDKYIFSYIKANKIKHSLKSCFLPIYIYDSNNSEFYFKSYQEAAQYIGVDYKGFANKIQKGRIKDFILSKTKIDNFKYIPFNTSYYYELTNLITKEVIIYNSLKEVRDFLGLTRKSVCIERLNYRLNKLNFTIKKCPFRK